MKSITERLHQIALIIMAPALYIFLSRKGRYFLTAFALVLFMAGCFREFYKTNTQNTINASNIEKLKNRQKIFFAHFQDTVVSLENLTTNGIELEAVTYQLSVEQINSLIYQKQKPNQYKLKKDPGILMQVHFYSNYPKNTFQKDSTQKLSIPYTSINRLDVYEKDVKKTSTNHFLSVLLIIGIVLAGSAIFLAIACNCPQVYVQEGNKFEFKSGLYSGAVNSKLERSDYLLLDNFSPSSDSLKIRIENVKGEEQFINRLQLLRVKHPAGTKVLADKFGKIYSYSTPVAPLSVRDISGIDYTKQVKYKDTEQAGFVQPGTDGSASSLIFHFPAQKSGKKARLILRAANTPWSGYLYKEFLGMQGNAYTMLRNNQEKMERSVAENWILGQSLPLKVYVENEKGEWQMADYFQTPGNTAKRDLIMELDIPATLLQTTRIKLETVYRFWDIDYAALDTDEQPVIESEWINPAKAMLSTGENMANQISREDKSYLSLKGNAYLDLIFSPLKADNDNSSYILSGTGYYHQSPANNNNPDLANLNKFKNPGAFQSYSVEEFEKVNTTLAKLLEDVNEKKNTSIK